MASVNKGEEKERAARWQRSNGDRGYSCKQIHL